MRKLILLILLASANGPAAAQSRPQTSSPSFACTAGGSVVERIICADPKLAAEDRLMVRLYSFARISAFGRGESNQPAAQREWLKSRDEACATSHDPQKCLSSSYAERNERLALAVLFSRPEVALPELRRLDPEAAPMFEAIFLYSSSPKLGDAERRRVIALLERYATTPGGWGEPGAAVTSDAAFAEFIGVRSAGMTGENYGRAFPCAAMIRKPKLIEATEPRFGSTMDNFVIQSDCPDTLPPLPKFSALVEKRIAGMSDCGGGSIRFAYYRSFWNAALAARLATKAQLRAGRTKAIARRRNVTNAAVTAAISELSAYYQRYGRADTRQAPRLARKMIYEMLEQAWQC